MARNRYSAYSPYIVVTIDLLVLTVLFFLFLFINDPSWERSMKGLLSFGKTQYKSLILMILSWLMIAGQVGLYGRFRFSRFLNIVKKIFFQFVLFGIILFAISGGKKENLYTNYESGWFLLILLGYLLVSRFLILQFIKAYRKKGFNQRNVIFLGINDNSEGLRNLLTERKDIGLHPLRSFNAEEITEAVLKDYLENNEVDFAYISLGDGLDDTQIKRFAEILEENYTAIGFIPSVASESRHNLKINYLDTFPILTGQKYPLDKTANHILKRIFDLVFTLILFALVLWWVLPILAIAVYFSQGKPILFAQKRNGLNGEEFNCLKFRTMRPDKLNNKKPTERNDPRVTKLGKILRKTSLDELPQFFNVLKGEMSIVGPRPHMVSENESYSEIIRRYSLRHYVKPGITGLAQVKGYRGAVDSNEDMEKRIRTDIYYVRNWSFLLDIYIIWQTVKLMIVGDKNAI